MSYEETLRPRKGSDATIQMFRQSDVMMDWINKKRQLATVLLRSPQGDHAKV